MLFVFIAMANYLMALPLSLDTCPFLQGPRVSKIEHSNAGIP
jgi:hypothetical protein